MSKRPQLNAQELLEEMRWKYANGPLPSRRRRARQARSACSCLVLFLFLAALIVVGVLAVRVLL